MELSWNKRRYLHRCSVFTYTTEVLELVRKTRQDGYRLGKWILLKHATWRQAKLYHLVSYRFSLITSSIGKKSRETRTCVSRARWKRVRGGSACGEARPAIQKSHGPKEQKEQKENRRNRSEFVAKVERACTVHLVYRFRQRQRGQREEQRAHSGYLFRGVESANRTHTVHRFQSPPVGSVVSEPPNSSDVAFKFSTFPTRKQRSCSSSRSWSWWNGTRVQYSSIKARRNTKCA